MAVRSPDIAVSPPALQFTETGYFVHWSDSGCQAFDRVAERARGLMAASMRAWWVQTVAWRPQATS
jgi:hypothetical protein